MKLLTIRGKVKQTLKSFNDGEGNKLTDSFSIANCLNHHFATVGKTMAQKIDEMDTNRLKDPLSYISNDVKIISKLDEKKSSHGIISNKVLKVINETIAPYLEILFHKYIISGVFPDCFKIAEVIPLFKGGEKKTKIATGLFPSYQPLVKFLREFLATSLISFFLPNSMYFPRINLVLEQHFRLNMQLLIFTINLSIILIKALAHVQYSWIWLRPLTR